MKFLTKLLVVIALFAALCAALPVHTLSPEEQTNPVKIRVKRQHITNVSNTNIIKCKVNEAWLHTKCVTCEKYLDLTGDCPSSCASCGLMIPN